MSHRECAQDSALQYHHYVYRHGVRTGHDQLVAAALAAQVADAYDAIAATAQDRVEAEHSRRMAEQARLQRDGHELAADVEDAFEAAQ